MRLEQNGERVIKWRPQQKLPNLPSFLLIYPFSLSMKGSTVCLYHSCHGQQNWVKDNLFGKCHLFFVFLFPNCSEAG